MYAYGDLRVETEIPTESGQPRRAEPVVYHFSPLYHFAGFVYLVPVVLAFVLLRENRSLQAAKILLPAGLLWLLWRVLVVMAPSGVGGGSANMCVVSLLCGFVTVWLLGDRIGSRHRLATFLMAGVVLLGCMMLMQVEVELFGNLRSVYLFGLQSTLVLLGGFAFAGYVCRRRFSTVRFSVVMIPGLALSVFLVQGIYLLGMALQSGISVQLYFLMFYSIFLGLQTVAYGLFTVPFLVLFFTNQFWRQRFAAVMGMGIRKIPVVECRKSNL